MFMVYLKGLFVTQNFTIKRVVLEYETNDEYENPDGWWHFFWTRKLRDAEKNTRYYSDVGFYYNQNFLRDIIRQRPRGVTNIKTVVRYIYNDKEYIYITKGDTFVWPPKKVPGFNPKIVKAEYLCGDSQDYLLDYILAYAGPFNDFHGQELTLDDIDIDRDIKLTNQSGASSIIKVDTIFHRRFLWDSLKVD